RPRVWRQLVPHLRSRRPWILVSPRNTLIGTHILRGRGRGRHRSATRSALHRATPVRRPRRRCRVHALTYAHGLEKRLEGRLRADAVRIGFLNDLFYGPELYRRTGRDVNFRFWLMKNPPLYRSARPESGREGRERFLIAPFGRTQSERRRRLALAGGLR